MIVQFKIFKYSQEAELNAFLKTAHLYHSESMPAIQCKEDCMVVRYTDSPDALAPFIAAETVFTHIRSNRELLVEDDMKIKQLSWRIEEKEKRIIELNEQKAPLEKDLEGFSAQLKAIPAGKKAEEQRAELNRLRREVADKLVAINAELNGANPKDAGIILQVENAKADIEVTKSKMDDRRKDIDMALAFAEEIMSGAYKIYRQEPANA